MPPLCCIRSISASGSGSGPGSVSDSVSVVSDSGSRVVVTVFGVFFVVLHSVGTQHF